MRSRIQNAVLFGALLLAVATLALAGPLNPPGGPVGSTFKTLQEVEPRTPINSLNTPGDASSLYKITQPGSYYLTGDVQALAGRDGIVVDADNVTIDMRGFTMNGEVTPLVRGVTAIHLPSTRNHFTVHDGTVRGWGQSGVVASELRETMGVRVERVQAINNGGAGILCGSASVVECSAIGNALTGIQTLSGSEVRGCISRNNGLYGFRVEFGSVITNCSATYNAYDGIHLIERCTVTACTVALNLQDGIEAEGGVTITGCTISDNEADGIRVEDDSTITGNTLVRNGEGSNQDAAGIHVLGFRNRIDSNNLSWNGRGIRVDGANNLIVRNGARGSVIANYSFAGGNQYGPVVTGTGQIASTSPWANFGD